MTISSRGGAGAVEIDAGSAVKILVQRFAGIFFKMRARQVHEFFNRRVTRAENYRKATTQDHRNFKLADLVALGQVRIEVVLAGENGARSNLGTDSQAEFDGAYDCLTIEHGQYTG